MKTVHYIFITVLLVAALFVRFDVGRRTALVKMSSNTSQKNAVIATNTTSVAPLVAEAPPSSKPFAVKFKEEAAQMAQLQQDPDAVQERLKKLATEMSQADVQELYTVISDDANNGDTRAMAVELLSLKNDTASLTALQNFVASNKNVNGKQWDRKKEFETVLRAQAVESIAAYPQREIALSTLNFLQNRVDEKFLADRINRAAANVLGRASSPQVQDEEALKQLVE